jgi:hypothetical protein
VIESLLFIVFAFGIFFWVLSPFLEGSPPGKEKDQ